MLESASDRICGWGGISIELGDRKRLVGSIEDAGAQFKERKLPMNPALLGYEYFHESTSPPELPIARAIAGALAASGVAAERIDLLLLASADTDFLGDRTLMYRLLDGLGLCCALPMAITAQECTTLLSALNLARVYAQSGAFGNILVVSYDRAKSDRQRIQSFGVVSDAVAACVLTRGAGAEFAIKGFSHKFDLRGTQDGDDFASRKSLIDDGTREALDQAGMRLDDVKHVFSTNFFTPLARYNAASLGASERQWQGGGMAETGHCLCADPLLNLWRHAQAGPSWRRGDVYLLQAYARGFLASMLVERLADPARADAAAAGRVAASAAIEQSW